MFSVDYVSGCSCYCGGGLFVLCVMFVFLFLLERVGDVVEAVGCKGESRPLFWQVCLVLFVCLCLCC